MTKDETLAAAFARQRDRLGEPPSTETLLAYRAGTLSDEERNFVLEYASVHPETARALLEIVRFPDVATPEDAEPLTSEDLEQQWRRFRAQLPEDLEFPHHTDETVSTAVESRASRGRPRGHWMPMAAAIVLAATLSFFAADQLRDDAPTASANPLIVRLAPDDRLSGPRSGDEGQNFADDARLAVVELQLETEVLFERYQVVVRDPSGTAIEILEVSARSTTYVTFTLDRGKLPAGHYKIHLFGLNTGDEAIPIDTYTLFILP